MKLHSLLCIAFLAAGSILANAQSDPVLELGKNAPKNLYSVSKTIYRSGQPDAAQFVALQKAGIKSVLNLRFHHSDADELRGCTIKLLEIKTNAGALTAEDLEQALLLIDRAEKPMLIHCWHGSDRTGAVVAASRIVFENWDVEKALREMKDAKYGHHSKIYSNLPKLIRNIDWDVMRKKIQNARKTTPAQTANK